MMAEIKKTEQEPKSTPSLEKVLLQCAFAEGRAISDDVREIDLGIFAQESNELRLETLMDPKRKEYGKLAYVTSDRRVLLQDKPTVGGEEVVYMDIQINITNKNTALPWFSKQDRMLGVGLHSHSMEYPPSSADMFFLLFGDLERFACVGVFIATPQRNILIFRGEGAPQYNFEQAKEKIVSWEKLLNERINKIGSLYVLLSGIVDIKREARETLLRQIAKKYNLRIFSGNANSPIVRLNSFGVA